MNQTAVTRGGYVVQMAAVPLLMAVLRDRESRSRK